MARGISPETNGGASLGSSAKNWAKVYTQDLVITYPGKIVSNDDVNLLTQTSHIRNKPSIRRSIGN